ncbi:hypothetical protein H0242_31440 (plasmid) [Bacillus thuringiensis serovar sumiyoshiensis]|uniref:hypothetical protein n=1 Tax=Bacillus thuringiensis TaxID=1428 RepID=UPI00399B87E9
MKQRYYIYAFDNSLQEWDFNTGKLIMITQDQEIVDCVKSHVFSLEIGDFFAKSVLEKKEVERLSNKENTKYWCHGFGRRRLRKLQNYYKVKFYSL